MIIIAIIKRKPTIYNKIILRHKSIAQPADVSNFMDPDNGRVVGSASVDHSFVMPHLENTQPLSLLPHLGGKVLPWTSKDLIHFYSQTLQVRHADIHTTKILYLSSMPFASIARIDLIYSQFP